MRCVIAILFAVAVLLTTFSEEAVDRLSKPGESLNATKGAAFERATPAPSVLPAEKQPSAEHTSRSNEAETMVGLLWRWLAPVLLGGVGAAVINLYWSHRSRNREAVGLTLVLTTEFVTAFNRCVTYCEQYSKGEISYSSLFVLSDASVLSRFASLVGKANLVMAAMNLKSHFFQIERHAEAASQFIMEANAVGDINQVGLLQARAQAEQGAVVAFFLSPYNEIVQDLDLLIKSGLKGAKRSVAQNLQGKLLSAMEKKSKVDSIRKTAKTATPTEAT